MRNRPFVSLALVVAIAACGNDIAAPRGIGDVPAAAAHASNSFSLYASAASSTQISLSWPDNERNETGWEIERSAAGSSSPFMVIASVGANAVSYLNSGLQPNTSYCYRVRSYRLTGKNRTYTAYSNAACAKTLGPPPAPGDVNATAVGSQSVSLTWGFVGAESYRIERAPDPGGDWVVLSTVTWTIPSNYLDYGVRPGERACYRVFALNGYGASPASNVDCTIPPVAPAGVTATRNGADVDVAWSDGSGLATQYEVTRSSAVLATLPGDARGYRDVAPPDGRWQYAVRSRTGDGGVSDYSYSDIVVVARSAPSAPVLDIVAYSSTVVTVSWWNTSGIAEDVHVQRSADGESGWVDVFSGSIWLGQYADPDRTPEERVCYRAFAKNVAGESDPSNVDCTFPLARASDFRVITDPTSGELTATWTDNSQHEEGYLLSVWECDYYYEYCDWSYIFAVDANVTTFTVAGYAAIGDVLAYGDGGYSDSALPADATQAMHAGTSMSTRTRASLARFSAAHSTRSGRP